MCSLAAAGPQWGQKWALQTSHQNLTTEAEWDTMVEQVRMPPLYSVCDSRQALAYQAAEPQTAGQPGSQPPPLRMHCMPLPPEATGRLIGCS